MSMTESFDWRKMMHLLLVLIIISLIIIGQTIGKSQPRHHCDFCKCWIADNKPSKDFHEKGKRHQENVKKRLDEIRKKGLKDAEQKAEMEDSLVEMERAAIEALKEDLKKDPSLAAQYGVTFKSKERPAPKESVPASVASKSDIPAHKEGPAEVSETVSTAKRKSERSEDGGPPPKSKKQKPKKAEDCVWKAEVTPEGYTYYWNIQTLERTWIKPDEYVDPEELSDEESDSESEPEKDVTGSESEPEPEKPVEVAEIPLPGPAVQESKTEEKTDDHEEMSAVGGVEEDTPDPVDAVGPLMRPDGQRAYGQWETVVKETAPEIDFELPKQEIPEVTVVPAETKMKFREKKVESLGDDIVLFKKRKVNKKPFSFRKKEGES